MNSQLNRNPRAASATSGTTHRIDAGGALRLGRPGGELSVVQGRAWLTRDDDPGDHLVEPGQRVCIGVAENAVIESWDRSQALLVRWQPRRQAFRGALLAEPLRGLAFVADRAAGGFKALARSAAASASRAQGCISAGDSMASSGALK
jgi:hypothetical protein